MGDISNTSYLNYATISLFNFRYQGVGMDKVTTLLFVRGLLGSGTTFLANNLAKQMKCEVIEKGDYENFTEYLDQILCKIERGDPHIVLVLNTIESTVGHIKAHLPEHRFNCQYYLADGNYMDKIGYSKEVPYSRRDRMKLRWVSNKDYVAEMTRKFPEHQHFDCYKGDGILK